MAYCLSIWCLWLYRSIMFCFFSRFWRVYDVNTFERKKNTNLWTVRVYLRKILRHLSSCPAPDLSSCQFSTSVVDDFYVRQSIDFVEKNKYEKYYQYITTVLSRWRCIRTCILYIRALHVEKNRTWPLKRNGIRDMGFNRWSTPRYKWAFFRSMHAPFIAFHRHRHTCVGGEFSTPSLWYCNFPIQKTTGRF